MHPLVKQLVWVFVLISLGAGKYFIQNIPQLRDAYQGPDLEPAQVSLRGDSLKKLSFGFDNFFSSLIWIRLLQEAKHTPIRSDTLSWEYSEVDSITTLDPNFDSAYHFGSMYVSFFRRDKEGGKLILEKWIKRQPTLWKAHHMLGMHYFLELNDYKAAAPHVIYASQLPGAPSYISSLGVGLLTQSGASLFALQSAIELFEASVQAESKMRLARRIRGLRFHLQRSAWEEALSNYKKTNSKNLPSSLADMEPFLKIAPIREVSSFSGKQKSSPEIQVLLSEPFYFKLGTNRNSIEPVNPEQAKEFDNIGVHLQKESHESNRN